MTWKLYKDSDGDTERLRMRGTGLSFMSILKNSSCLDKVNHHSIDFEEWYRAFFITHLKV